MEVHRLRQHLDADQQHDSVRADGPNDATHLISGLHEADGIVESKDSGETWTLLSGSNFPSGGIRGRSRRANWVTVTSDGTHQIFVGTMWSTGLWRHIEP